MRHASLFALLLCIGCSDLKPLPLVDSSAGGPPRSALSETIRAQLDSRRTERPPVPVPGSDTERLATLRDLPNRNAAGGAMSGARTP